MSRRVVPLMRMAVVTSNNPAILNYYSTEHHWTNSTFFAP